MVKLCIFATHPVQYHVPLWRALARQPGVDSRVFYLSDHGVRSGVDAGFGVPFAWDTDLDRGYERDFLAPDVTLEGARSKRIADLDALFRRERPDWVLLGGYAYPFQRQVLRAARARGTKVLLRAEFSDGSEFRRSYVKGFARQAYLRWFYSRVERFCYPGELGRLHLKHFGVRDSRMFFSPYSVDGDELVRSAGILRRSEARERLGIPPGRFVFLISGKMIPRKAPFTVLRAMESLDEVGRCGLIAMGDGVLRQSFEHEARALLGDRFIAPGFVNQSRLAEFFLAADAFVMPSTFETWGLVVNEAMHFGLPVISSDRVGCHADLVRDDRTGYVYRSDDSEQLAARMRLLMQSEQRCREMGQAARAHIERYSIAHSVAGILRALEA
jgi:glycosyltransferase involved in cell wall biosynthesis